MKNLLFFLLFPCFANAAKYYISPTGNDNNPGTITSPFKTWERISQPRWNNILNGGDTVFIRGGTYSSPHSSNGDDGVACYWQNINGTSNSYVVIMAYPGENPILDCSNVTPFYSDPWIIYMTDCNYVKVKGLHIRSLNQVADGSGVSRGMMTTNCTFITLEQIEADHCGGNGFDCVYANDITYLNCDSHHNADNLTDGGADAFDNADGFNRATNGSTRTTYIGCRTWMNSDDGWDLINSPGTATFSNCWGMRNGYYQQSNGTIILAGNGEGFKLGFDPSGNPAITRWLNNCLAFDNGDAGFNNNGDPQTRYQLYNCAAFRNGAYGFEFGYGNGEMNTFKNNISYNNSGGALRYYGPNTNNTNNTWNGGVTLNNSDFQSLDTTGVTGTRQADGSLPILNFMKLSAGSDLVDAGTPVGLPYTGSAPDMGAFEYATSINIPPTAIANIDQITTLPVNSITLSGSGTDPDGTITAYLWTRISGPTSGTIATTTAASTSVTELLQGIYRFELKVTDNSGATDTDTVQVTVNAATNQAPTANAGLDKNISLPTNTVSLTGSGTDPDGTISAYLWTKISGPGSGTITTLTSAVTTVTALVQGVYKFELKVTDNNGATDTDTIQVTVNATNLAPTASAGIDQSISLPTNSVSLNGSGTDPDGTISAYLWTKISGPAGGTITNTTTATTTVTGLLQGVYQFELKVTDNNATTDTDTIQVTVNAAANLSPTAIAGIDQTISLPTNSVSLNGSGTDPDGTISTYLWTKISGPASGTITNSSLAITTVTGLVQGVYQFQLQVTDNSGATGTDIIQVTVNTAANQAPTAVAGPDQNITLPLNSVSLSGSGTDPDGTITAYRWRKVAGPVTFTISSTTSANTTVTGLVQGVYQFELRVTDNNGATARDTMQVTVTPEPNQAPTADAGPDQNITLPLNDITLSGSGTDPDGTISTYLWTKISGPASGTITNTASETTTVTGLVQGVYQFQLQVTDNDGETDTDVMQVTVNPAPNQGPAADAGSNQTITLPVNTVTLSGSGTDPDGTIVSYLWIKLSGPASGTIANTTSATTTVTGLVQGIYQFQLLVTDNDGATDTDVIQVNVNTAPPPPNQAPVSNAGLDKNITLPTNSVGISGSGTDPDGTITAYLWRKISGPTSGTIASTTAATTTATGLVQGVYKFELKVTDNSGATARDTMQVTVNAAINQLPTANAGLDKNITLPTSSVSLSGSGTDPDGTITAYLWRKISGPTSGIITNATSAITSATGLVQGIYKFELKVTDNSAATDTDTMQVTVNPAPNQAPTAESGPNQTITLPVNTITLSGSGTDPDGTIVSYLWIKLSGPASGTITNAASATTSVTGLAQGVYQFQLQVTDNSGATDTDVMQVNVNAANQVPVANAGLDQNITLPTNSISLNGSGTDPDGTIVSYLWTKISGPTSGTITNAASATTSATGLVLGLYKFQLRVTDNSGATDTDTMQVTVNTAINQPPTANAGLDKNITLPTNSVSLNGSGTDPDGTIAAYLWTKISGPISGAIINAASATTSVTGLVQGVYKFQLRVTDNSGATDTDTMQVTVNAANLVPIANAGLDQNITLPTSSVSLNGSGTDADGTIAAYLWTKISGPTSGTITNTTAATTSVTGLVQGVYKFQLRVTDNSGATDTDTMQVTVNAAVNQPPVANAGFDQNITLPTSSVSLNGSGTDPNGTITTYLWTKISGPTSSTITNTASATTSVSGLVQGVYKFQLRVTDNSGATDTDTMQVTVNAAVNQPPTANAGLDQNITLPTNSVSLSGSGTDPDGTISAYLWTKISGPASGTIANTVSATTSVTGLTEGIYEFQLRVTDNSGATDTDIVQVTVNADTTPNVAPIANAGTDTSIYLPENSVTLSGSGADADGQIVSYNWSVISGTAYLLTNSNSAISNLADLQQGIYEVVLTVTDNSGVTGKDTITITIGAGRQSLNDDVRIIGNPVQNTLIAEISSVSVNRQMKVVLFNINGVLLHEKNLRLNQNIQLEKIDMTRYSRGTYILQVYFDKKTPVVRKVIKM